eukprot:250136-Pyramimonas_sp.AAC.1
MLPQRDGPRCGPGPARPAKNKWMPCPKAHGKGEQACLRPKPRPWAAWGRAPEISRGHHTARAG